MKPKTYIEIPFMTGTQEDVSVTFLNSTFCVKNDQEKGYPDPVFGEWLINEIFSRQKIMAVKKGVFKKKFVCPSCNKELNPEMKRFAETDLELKLKNFKPFTLKISMPVVECPNCQKCCGLDLDGLLESHIADAIIHAFETQNIKP